MLRYKLSKLQPTESHSRRNTERESFSSLSRYLSACLGFEERQGSRGNTVEVYDSEIQLEKCLVERALCKHSDDLSINVLYFRFLTWR